jgi:hypothetical protein
MLTEEEKANHEEARRWIAAVNNRGRLGHWAFHVCRDPQLLERELSIPRRSLSFMTRRQSGMNNSATHDPYPGIGAWPCPELRSTLLNGESECP